MEYVHVSFLGGAAIHEVVAYLITSDGRKILYKGEDWKRDESINDQIEIEQEKVVAKLGLEGWEPVDWANKVFKRTIP